MLRKSLSISLAIVLSAALPNITFASNPSLDLTNIEKTSPKLAKAITDKQKLNFRVSASNGEITKVGRNHYNVTLNSAHKGMTDKVKFLSSNSNPPGTKLVDGYIPSTLFQGFWQQGGAFYNNPPNAGLAFAPQGSTHGLTPYVITLNSFEYNPKTKQITLDVKLENNDNFPTEDNFKIGKTTLFIDAACLMC